MKSRSLGLLLFLIARVYILLGSDAFICPALRDFALAANCSILIYRIFESSSTLTF